MMSNGGRRHDGSARVEGKESRGKSRGERVEGKEDESEKIRAKI
jgi:hypothetical protein